ncbi:hypothetical protein AB4076_00250 [Dyella sp. 2RAF44]|uniref:hypothetical protein n=1 Tax=Dyella sp. 2RAF44 TaxID=3233000 RepID=UPI003F93EE23
MTAIALLNVNTDPHLVADTLLSVKGQDPKSPRRIWLPALGLVSTEYESHEGVWYISRLGRKTFFLPNGAGILAFAGDCHAAFQFWAALSAKYLAREARDPSFRVNAALIDQTIHQLGACGRHFSLLGVLVDPRGERAAYFHNQHVRLQTASFGTCYLSGSGWTLIKQTIMGVDKLLASSKGWPGDYPISATEDLAEHISSVMLYHDSDNRNGKRPGSPLSHFTGGFYEWYQVGNTGVRPMSPRVDINIRFDDDRVIITRAYFVEQLERRRDPGAHKEAREFPVFVMNLLLDPYEIDAGSIDDGGHVITLGKTRGVLAASTLRSYDATEEDRGDLSGPIYPEMLEELFSDFYKVHRVRVVAVANNQSKTRRLISAHDQEPDAVLHYENDVLSMWLSPRVLARPCR